MHRRTSTLLPFILVLALALPSSAAAQVAGTGTKISIAGSGFVGGDFTNLTNIFGLTRFMENGLELGGDILLSVSKRAGSAVSEGETTFSGFGFGRLNYNFIGESTFVPFVSFGFGVPLEKESTVDFLANAGLGFKKFLNERVSFDAQAMVQGQQIGASEFGPEGGFELQDGVSLFYGLSIYLGN